VIGDGLGERMAEVVIAHRQARRSAA
jgi:hypothetical protein